ncbi:hypothetical protein QY95_02647 [Bacillus thermotolerans]|uniref:Uncharacterized protein n=1 Tax=Bacillus thermotolerans TaxID=1221996 RepID=A0A0F5ID17_BACTR|nr:hypothetical protein QY95_02647 [Bacillus thermotolerans]
MRNWPWVNGWVIAESRLFGLLAPLAIQASFPFSWVKIVIILFVSP